MSKAGTRIITGLKEAVVHAGGGGNAKVRVRTRRPPDRLIRLEYTLIDGAHFWTSPDVPGLCAAHREFDIATRAIGIQLAQLLKGRTGWP